MELVKVDPTERPNVILMALQGKPMYQGTVPGHVKSRRRAANKVAKRSRQANR
jgi:hypothetical protein